MLKLKKLKKINPSEERTYQIKPLFSILKDEISVKYHVEQDDYFGTIATIISLVYQKLKNNKSETPKKEEKREKRQVLQALESLEQDLVFLQNNYQIYIRPKTKNKKIIPKGKLKSQ